MMKSDLNPSDMEQCAEIVDEANGKLSILYKHIYRYSYYLLPDIQQFYEYQDLKTPEAKTSFESKIGNKFPVGSDSMLPLLQLVDVYRIWMDEDNERINNFVYGGGSTKVESKKDRLITKYSNGKLISVLELYDEFSKGTPHEDGFSKKLREFMDVFTKLKSSNSLDVLIVFTDSCVENLLDDIVFKPP